MPPARPRQQHLQLTFAATPEVPRNLPHSARPGGETSLATEATSLNCHRWPWTAQGGAVATRFGRS